jgi:hypothetical protein
MKAIASDAHVVECHAASDQRLRPIITNQPEATGVPKPY